MTKVRFEDDPKEQKQKLTLSIAKDVIEKAKDAEVNISAITEQVLKAITYEPHGNTLADVAAAYQALFDAITPVLKTYGATVEVGKETLYDDSGEPFYNSTITLGSYGLYQDGPDQGARVTAVDVVRQLFPPKRILENLIPQLIQAAAKNKERMKEFQTALKFVEILPSDESNE